MKEAPRRLLLFVISCEKDKDQDIKKEGRRAGERGKRE